MQIIIMLLVARMTSSKTPTTYSYPLARAAIGAHAKSQDFEDLALYEQFFQGQRNGRFLEMGALDGVGLSNTYAYETALNWTGVLIEANPEACPRLFRNRPKAINLCSAVSNDHRPITFEEGLYRSTFGAVNELSPIFKEKFHKMRRRTHQVPSAPLGQLLRAVGVAYLDLVSLDVEGSEVKVLETMDWTIPVRVWCIEWQEQWNPASMNASIASIMSRHGYERHQWAYEGRSGRPLEQNQLWVWKKPWRPDTYEWKQYHAAAAGT
jgi:FkbM family methyltransferase